MGIKDALKKIKPQEQSCCSVEIEQNQENKEEKIKKSKKIITILVTINSKRKIFYNEFDDLNDV
ncbi:hypothetical protein [Staphylococcus nepalensis]|uniref:hypothetical protein n=1 Tax=Staphylococcus nepalensis TaxID=214473 RepID=UPI00383ACDB8